MWLLYGANGTTGRVLLRMWAEQGAWSHLPPPILSGRPKSLLAALAQNYGLSHRACDLAQLSKQDFSGIRLVVNFAGPFEETQEAWLKACEKHGLDYLDISGEWRSIEALYERSTHYEAINRALILAAGFDTIAGEAALWTYLQKFPAHRRLRLGIYAEGGFSAGTARSAFRMLPHGFWAYDTGRFVPFQKPLTRSLPDGRKRRFLPATLAELKTFPAWQAVERLETYVALPPRYSRWAPLLENILAIQPIAKLFDKILSTQRIRLASSMDLSASSYLFVEAEGGEARLWIETEQAYVFTARAVLETVGLYFQMGGRPGVGSAFSRYSKALWERLPFRVSWLPA